MFLPFYAFASIAMSQDLVPSDAELRSAYCLPVVKAEIKLARDAIAMADANKTSPIPAVQENLTKASEELRKGLVQAESALNRLQAYLVPRVMARDPVALMAATQRGEADLRALESMAAQYAACRGVTDDKACIDSYTDKDLVARIRACANPTWLPF
jgi:hypothetical protein